MRYTRLILGMIFFAGTLCGAEKQDSLGTVVFSINPAKYGIKIESDGQSAESGPTAFSIAGNKLSIVHSDFKRILVINKSGDILKMIQFPRDIGHFDFDSVGNGYVAVGETLCVMKDYAVANRCKTKFSMKANDAGRFRIDLLPINRVRIISFSPDFLLSISRDSICKATPAPKTGIDSLLIRELSSFVGVYKGYYVFMDYNFTASNIPYFKIIAFDKIGADSSTTKNYSVTGTNIGCFIMWSFPLRIDEIRGCCYAMFYENKQIVIREFDLHKLLGI